MKKHMKLVAAVATLLIAAAGVITFEACNKKNEVANNIPELNVVELSDMDKEMILFGEKMKAAQKGGETMQLEEAIRNLSNYENFKMCDASRYSTDMERLTIESIIPVTEGNVYLSDINSLYESTKNKIIEKLNGLENDDKTVYFISNRIQYDSKDGDNIRIITDWFLSGRYIGLPSDFGETDYWSPFVNGLCGPYYGQGGNAYNAVTRINLKLQSLLNLPSCQVGYRMYIIYNNSDVEFLTAHEFIDTNSPNGHYGLIYLDYESSCLSPDDMNYYYHNIRDKLLEWGAIYAEQELYLVMVEYSQLFPISTVLEAIYGTVECTYVGIEF